MDSLYTAVNADSMLATIPNLATQANENGFPFIKKFRVAPATPQDTTITGYRPGSVHVGTPSSCIYTFSYGTFEVPISALHTHPASAYPAHSAGDVYILLEKYQQNSYYSGTFVAAADGSQYALTITDYAKATNFLSTKSLFLDGDKWREDSEIGKAFKAAQKYFADNIYKSNPNVDNLSYEMAMAAVLKQFDVGITLNKKDAGGNFKPLIVKTGSDPKKPKRTIYVQECN